MKELLILIKDLIRPVLVSAVFFMVLTGLIYPLLTTAVANVLFPYQAQGSLIRKEGVIIGSKLIGQQFTSPQYFHPRPSYTLEEPYNATASWGSNLGPTNSVLIKRVAERVEAYRAINGLPDDIRVPVDAVTASSSGLDPHISVANALIQAKRVAAQRNLPVREVRRLIVDHMTRRQFGLLGEPRVNVLQLNLALDVMPHALNQP